MERGVAAVEEDRRDIRIRADDRQIQERVAVGGSHDGQRLAVDEQGLSRRKGPLAKADPDGHGAFRSAAARSVIPFPSRSATATSTELRTPSGSSVRVWNATFETDDCRLLIRPDLWSAQATSDKQRVGRASKRFIMSLRS